MASLGATGAPIVQRPLAALSGRPATGYVIAPGADPTATGAALVSDVRAFALPWFAATATVDGLLAWLAADDLANASHANGYIAGLILAREGRRDEAREQFQHADGVRDVIVATARNLGIDL
jgi:nucleotide-binding universal stress UspA family protein